MDRLLVASLDFNKVNVFSNASGTGVLSTLPSKSKSTSVFSGSISRWMLSEIFWGDDSDFLLLSIFLKLSYYKVLRKILNMQNPRELFQHSLAKVTCYRTHILFTWCPILRSTTLTFWKFHVKYELFFLTGQDLYDKYVVPKRSPPLKGIFSTIRSW